MSTPIVFVHGVGLDATMWDGIIAQLRDDFACIAIDMAGHGESSHPAADALSGYVGALELDLSAQADGPVYLVGFSMGAMVAAAFTLHHPERVSKLVLMNAVYKRDAAAREAVLGRLEDVKKTGLTVIADAAISRWFSEEFIIENPDIIQAVRDCLISNDLDSYLPAYRVFATADEELAPKFNQITCPVLAVTADGDMNSTPAMSVGITDAVQDGRTVIWGGLAHGAPIEEPARVADTLKEFLDEGTAS